MVTIPGPPMRIVGPVVVGVGPAAAGVFLPPLRATPAATAAPAATATMTPIIAPEMPPPAPAAPPAAAPPAPAPPALPATADMLTGTVAVSGWPATVAETPMLNVLAVDALTAPVEAMPAALVVTIVEAAPFAKAAEPPDSCEMANMTVTPATGTSLVSDTRITDSELITFFLRFFGLPAAERISILYLGTGRSCC